MTKNLGEIEKVSLIAQTIASFCLIWCIFYD